MDKKIKHRMRFRRSSDSRHATFSSRRTAGKGTSIVFDGSNGLGDPNRMESWKSTKMAMENHPFIDHFPQKNLHG
jgi:hypothetical protein